MSFSHDYMADAGMSVEKLQLHIQGLGVFDLSRVTVTMRVNAECSAVCVPATGYNGIAGKRVEISKLSELTPNHLCRVYMQLGGGNFKMAKGLLFTGRMSGKTLQVLSNTDTSNAEVQIHLRHVSIADLSGIEIAQRTYYATVSGTDAFRMPDATNLHYSNNALDNQESQEGRFAEYIRDLADALFKWYTNGGTGGINIPRILKAVPCRVKDSVKRMGNKNGNMSGSFCNMVERTFQGAMGSKASLLSVVSTLCNWCLFNLIPTSDSLIISPRLNVTQWVSDEKELYIEPKNIINIMVPYMEQRIPIEKVCLSYNSFIGYFSTSGKVTELPLLNKQWIGKYIWPQRGDPGGAVLVDPPPMLAGLVDVSANAGTQVVKPKPLSEGGRADDSVNSEGARPLEYVYAAADAVGTIAARLQWARLAFSQRSLNVQVLPHWLFSDVTTVDKRSISGDDLRTGTPWVLLGATVKLNAPYRLLESRARNDYQKADDIAYIGYVNEMTLDVSVPDAKLRASIVLTNVRSEEEDKDAFPFDQNPIYDNTEQQPV